MATSRQLRDEIAAGRRDAALAALYGGSKSVLDRQRSRYCAALDQFELYYGPGRQVQVYSAPGRTELGGNHTDHQHGYGLAGAVTLDLVAVASRNEDGFIRVKSRGFNKLDVIDLTEAEPQQGESTHSASLIRGIADGFRTKGFGIGGFDAYTASDVLRGSGLSSSAAFEMGMAVILNTEYGCGLDAPALARICQFAENAYFGKPSGLLDQLTSAVGGVLFADFADPAAPKIEKIHADGVLPEGMTLCVTDTRASHSELSECLLRRFAPISGPVGGAGPQPEHPRRERGRMADAGRRLCRDDTGLCAGCTGGALLCRNGIHLRPGLLLSALSAGAGGDAGPVNTKKMPCGMVETHRRRASFRLGKAHRRWAFMSSCRACISFL